VGIVIIDVTDLVIVESLNEVTISNKEGSILGVLRIGDLGLVSSSPKRATI
jgi:hypothetical protein